MLRLSIGVLSLSGRTEKNLHVWIFLSTDPSDFFVILSNFSERKSFKNHHCSSSLGYLVSHGIICKSQQIWSDLMPQRLTKSSFIKNVWLLWTFFFHFYSVLITRLEHLFCFLLSILWIESVLLSLCPEIASSSTNRDRWVCVQKMRRVGNKLVGFCILSYSNFAAGS